MSCCVRFLWAFCHNENHADFVPIDILTLINRRTGFVGVIYIEQIRKIRRTLVCMQSKVGEIYEGKVTGLTAFGAFVKLSNGETGMVHISEVTPVFVNDIKDHVKEGQDVKVKVIAINEANKISLSIKQALPKQDDGEQRKKKFSGSGSPKGNSGRQPFDRQQRQSTSNSSGSMSFEDMMAKFKAESDEKISALKRSEQRSNRRGNK